MPFPMQPLVLDEKGVARFQENRIVSWLLDTHIVDMNEIAVASQQGQFTEEEQTQFAQLIGYSLCGFHELPYVSDADALAASAEAYKLGADIGGCRDHRCAMHWRGDEEE